MFHKSGHHGPLGPCANDCPACLRQPKSRRTTYDSAYGKQWLAEFLAARKPTPAPSAGPTNE